MPKLPNLPLNFSEFTGEAYYVYPRLMSHMADNNITIEALSIVQNLRLSGNTITKIRTGLFVMPKTIERCSDALKILGFPFDFESEKMSAQGHYRQEAVKRYIGNKPRQEAAKSLGIEEYMLDWIYAERKVSEEFHKNYIENKI